MKLIKNILIGFGAIFVLIIGLFIFVAGSSSEFKDKHEQFVKDYTREFSKNWEIENISLRTTNDLLAQINTTKGKQAVNVFRSLGKLLEISDMELGNYNSRVGGPTTGEFKFKASFENAKTIVTVTIREVDDKVKVQGFHVNPIGSILQPKEVKA